MNVSIVIPIYNPDKEVLDKSLKMLKKQKFKGKIQILKIDRKMGLAASLNYGIKKAKYDIVVSLHQDCIPDGVDWLSNLTEPLKNKENIVSVSKVFLPEELWDKFDLFAKAMTIKEKGTIKPLMDEKGCAYKKDILEKVGMFNEKDFRTAGEDFDLYLKMKDYGKIAYPDCRVIHLHETNWERRLKKNYQNANGYGALVRIHGRKMSRVYAGVLKAVPIVGLILSWLSYPFVKYIKLFPFYLIISPVDHVLYVYGFWKGFLMGKQTV